VILAVALASVNPRGGRSGNMIFVLLTFVVYNNLVNLGQSWIFVGLISFSNFLLLLHGGVCPARPGLAVQAAVQLGARPARRSKGRPLAVRDSESHS
jgi:lipopolysaccharide export system permease protein